MEKPPQPGWEQPNPYPPPGAAPPPGYPPPGAAGPPTVDVAYVPGAPQGGVTVINAPPSVYFGNYPVTLDCKFCHAHVTTEIEFENGGLVWVIFGILFLLGFFFLLPWCFCWIPFCIDSCKDVIHRCPNCRRVLGCYKAMFGRSEMH